MFRDIQFLTVNRGAGKRSVPSRGVNPREVT